MGVGTNGSTDALTQKKNAQLLQLDRNLLIENFFNGIDCHASPTDDKIFQTTHVNISDIFNE